MPIKRQELATSISDRLHVLAGQLKTRSRASLTDANHSLEFVMARFFNALLGWNLADLNAERADFPAADLGDRGRRIAMQITVEETSQKISGTVEKAVGHGLGVHFDRLIIFFLLPRKPGMPRKFAQPEGGPEIECWDLTDLLKRMNNLPDVSALATAAKVLDEEMGASESRQVGTSLHQLPPRPSGFVGREADLAKLRALNPAAGAVLTGLRGMGGIGKTALALVLAHEWAARFPDAQLFLDARGTQPDPPIARQLMEQVVLAFHPTAKLPDDAAAIAGIYRDVLGGKKVLILLDNALGAEQAKPLIPPAGCALIVTSRHSFMLGTVKPHDVGRLPDDEANALLREFAPDLTEAEAATLVPLCAGLPLALRLAGSHIALDAAERNGPPDFCGYILALGEGPLATLDADAPGAGEVTISETLRLSETQLPEAEREAWRKLGVFTASFDARAAQAIVGTKRKGFVAWLRRTLRLDRPLDMRSALERFVRRSLLEREGVERFKLHDLAADYARAQLGADALAGLHLIHARHYTAVSAETDELYLKGDVVGGLALFDRERAQIEAAYAWLTARGDEAGAQQLLMLVNAVVYTGQALRFHPRQRIAWLESQLRAARIVKHRQAEGSALGGLGIAHAAMGDARQAIGFSEQHLAIAREIGDRHGEGAALGNLGNVHGDLGDVGKAIEFYEQSLVICREMGDRRGEGSALGNLGLAHADLGDARQAIGFYEQHAAIAREIGDRREEGNALGNLGVAHKNLGDARKAIECHEQALVVFREIGGRQMEGTVLGNLGIAHSTLGDTRKAIEFYEQQLVIVREIGDRRGEGNALWSSALAHDSLGNRPEALARAAAALAIYEAIESPHATKVRAALAEWRGEPQPPTA
jgi:tetratricopeptide (TPR) repeat protein